MSAFYRRGGDRYIPSALVTGPWDDEHCHAGAPSALLTDRIARVAPDLGMARIAFDIPAPIPIAPVTVSTDVARPGKRVMRITADMVGDDGRIYLSANAWLIRIDTTVAPLTDASTPTPPPPEESRPVDVHFHDTTDILDGVELRAAESRPFEDNPATAWVHRTAPLVDGEEASPYADVTFAADWANGFSRLAPFEDLVAINTDLTVHFARPPTGSWVAVRALTISHGLGLGMTDSLVYDASGFVARSNQSIYFDAT